MLRKLKTCAFRLALLCAFLWIGRERRLTSAEASTEGVRVVSVGGVGTTFIMHYLSQHAPGAVSNDGNDRDKLKHSLVHHGEKVLYMVGEARHAIQSHYRRRWAQIQMGKLGTADPEAHDKCGTLYEYISLASERGEDLFGIRKHFEIWSRRENVMVVSLESIDADPGPVADFLGVGMDVFEDFEYHPHPAPEWGIALDPMYDALWDEMQRWVFGFRPSRCVEVGLGLQPRPRFAYLIMDRDLQSSYEAQEWCESPDADCDAFVLTRGADPTKHRDSHIASPGILWAAGRNLLLRTAMETANYEYYTFIGEDTKLVPAEQCLESRRLQAEKPFLAAFRCWQAFLRERQPVLAYAGDDTHPGFMGPAGGDQAVTAHFAFDAAFNSFHRSAAAMFLPYVEDLDDKSFFYCQYILNLLSAMFINSERLLFSGVLATSSQRDRYTEYRGKDCSKPSTFVKDALTPLGRAELCRSMPNPLLEYEHHSPYGPSFPLTQPLDLAVNPFGSVPPPVLSEAQILRLFDVSHPFVGQVLQFRRSLPASCALWASQTAHGRNVSLPIQSATFPDLFELCAI